MLKTIGAVLILLSSIILSYLPLYHSKQRILFLQGFIHDLHYIHNELQTNLSSIPCVIDYMCVYGSKNTQPIYQELKRDLDSQTVAMFSKLWSDKLKCCHKELLVEEQSSLSHLGNILGRYTLEEQLSYIDNVICVLEKGCNKTNTEYFKKKNLYVGIGGTLGMILVILLV